MDWSAGWTGALDRLERWTGALDWSAGLERWTGALDGLERWMDWSAG